jgi:acyl-coenzyme A thioesterase PaaI-like protein
VVRAAAGGSGGGLARVAIGMLAAPSGYAIATAILSVQYLRPAYAPLTFLGMATKRGRTLVFIDVAVEDVDGRITTSASGTMMIVPYADSNEEPIG